MRSTFSLEKNITPTLLLLITILNTTSCLNPKLKGRVASTSASTTATVPFVYPLSSGTYRLSADPYFAAPFNGQSVSGAISADGTKVLFYTYATNYGSDTNGAGISDVIYLNISTGQSMNVSTSSAGIAGNADSFTGVDTMPPARAFSPDGTKVLFNSQASNLDPVDTNGVDDCFVKDLVTNVTTVVNTSSAGVIGNGWSGCLGFSNDGTKVYFTSSATNIDPLDLSGNNDMYVKNLITGTTNIVTLDNTGAPTWMGAFGMDISEDEQYILWTTQAAMAATADGNGQYDCYRRQLGTNNVIHVSTGTGGTVGTGGGVGNCVFGGGQANHVYFSSAATANLVAGDTNGQSDVFYKDVLANTTIRVSTDSVGTEAIGGMAGQWNMSRTLDPNVVFFNSAADNLVAGDGGGTNDFYLKNRSTGAISLMNPKFGGGYTATAGSFSQGRISRSGQVVFYSSNATDLISSPDTANMDVYIYVLY